MELSFFVWGRKEQWDKVVSFTSLYSRKITSPFFKCPIMLLALFADQLKFYCSTFLMSVTIAVSRMFRFILEMFFNGTLIWSCRWDIGKFN